MKVFEIGVTFIKCPFLFCEVVTYVYGVKCDCVPEMYFSEKEGMSIDNAEEM
jgi:hypothetical protein